MIDVLKRLERERGLPKRLSVDNGPEFAGKVIDAWAHKKGVERQFIQPGKPVENAFIEIFNGRFRDERLSEYWSSGLVEARRMIEARRRDFNDALPHRSLGCQTPAEFLSSLSCNADLRASGPYRPDTPSDENNRVDLNLNIRVSLSWSSVEEIVTATSDSNRSSIASALTWRHSDATRTSQRGRPVS